MKAKSTGKSPANQKGKPASIYMVVPDVAWALGATFPVGQGPHDLESLGSNRNDVGRNSGLPGGEREPSV
jgi:hypothetical protein